MRNLCRHLQPPALVSGACLAWLAFAALPSATTAAHAAPRVAFPAGSFSTADGVWAQLPPITGRWGHAAIHDPSRQRVVVFGGYDGSRRNDVWALPLGASAQWIQLDPAGPAPLGRMNTAAIYDPVRDRLILYGGDNDAGSDDLWELTFTDPPEWHPIAALGVSPGYRISHAAVYDPSSDRMLLFGGTGTTGFTNELWELSLSGTPTWTRLLASGPVTKRVGHTLTYDPVRERVTLFGGFDGAYRKDLWELSLGVAPSWSAIAPPGELPEGRSLHSAIYDPNGDRLVIFAGVYAYGNLNDVWWLPLAAGSSWTVLNVSGNLPAARSGHSAIYDPLGQEMVVFGGGGSGIFRDIQRLPMAGTMAWLADPMTNLPAIRDYWAGAHVASPERMLIFGGASPGPATFNDLWSYDLTGHDGWTWVRPSGPKPAARWEHCMAHDTQNNRLFMFGGMIGPNSTNEAWLLGTTLLDLWISLAPAGTPPSARHGSSAIYDPVRNRMLVFGGQDPQYRNDVWALSLDEPVAWTQLAPSGSPPPVRAQHSAIYDPEGDRMIVFGGYAGGTPFGDVWELALASGLTWSQLSPSGSPPPGRRNHSAVLDSKRHRMVVFAGRGPNPLDDVWALDLGGSPAWTELQPGGPSVAAMGFPVSVYDPPRDRMVVFYGTGYALTWGDVVGVTPAAAPARTRLEPAWPNPARRVARIPVVIERSGPIGLRVFDLAGRIVAQPAAGEWPAGRHEVPWDLRGPGGSAVAAGVYVVELRAGASRASSRIVVLP